MGLVDPLLTKHGTNIHCGEVILAAQEEEPSHFPIYAVIITQEESTSDVL